MTGKLYGVGTGPGDPELMTLKAIRIVRESDVIAIPVSNIEIIRKPLISNRQDANIKELLAGAKAYQIALPNIPEMKDKPVLAVPMPMIKDKAELKKIHDEGAQAIIELLKKGKNISFLTIGDPTVYSTYLYIHKRIEQMGYSAEIINGIPSFCSAASTFGIGLAENKDEIHIIPSSYGVENALQLSGTKILMKAGKKMSEIKNEIEKTEQKFYMIENCGMADEKKYTDISQIPNETSYFSLVILK